MFDEGVQEEIVYRNEAVKVLTEMFIFESVMVLARKRDRRGTTIDRGSGLVVAQLLVSAAPRQSAVQKR